MSPSFDWHAKFFTVHNSMGIATATQRLNCHGPAHLTAELCSGLLSWLFRNLPLGTAGRVSPPINGGNISNSTNKPMVDTKQHDNHQPINRQSLLRIHQRVPQSAIKSMERHNALPGGIHLLMTWQLFWLAINSKWFGYQEKDSEISPIGWAAGDSFNNLRGAWIWIHVTHHQGCEHQLTTTHR